MFIINIWGNNIIAKIGNRKGINMENQENKKHLFLKGTLAGIISILLIGAVVFVIFNKQGYIHIGTDGQIFVQDTSVTETQDGIGNKVLTKLNTLEQVLNSFYFADVDDSNASENIYKAYLNSFGDKYTVYYTAAEYADFTQAVTGNYYGIGVVVSKNDDGTIKVVLPYENCPGSEAGMLIGDVITKVNGVSVMDRDLDAVVAEIKGAEGSTVEIELVRENVADPITLTVERRKIDIPTVEHKMLDNKIGYISVAQFDAVTYAQFLDAYKALTADGMLGLVIDIRSNPGGSLDTVVNMLDEILPDGMIVYTVDKDGKKIEYKGKNTDVIKVPLAVLVNGDSASASEIFAGAVQDYGVGTIVGTTTFGKGIVQTVKQLTDGSAIKFTISKYFTPKGQEIQGKGVTPDVVIDLDEAVKTKTSITLEEDNQLQKAIEIIKGKMAQ